MTVVALNVEADAAKSFPSYAALGLAQMERGNCVTALHIIDKALAIESDVQLRRRLILAAVECSKQLKRPAEVFQRLASASIEFANDSDIHSMALSEHTKVVEPMVGDFASCLEGHSADQLREIGTWLNRTWKHPYESVDTVTLSVAILSRHELGCVLNRSLPLDHFFFNAYLHYDILSITGHVHWADQVLKLAMQRHSTSQFHRKALIGSIRRDIFIDKPDIEHLIKRIARIYPNDVGIFEQQATAYFLIGDMSRLRRATERIWKDKLATWLEQTQPRCLRRVVVDWFDDKSVQVSAPIAPEPLRSFGKGQPHSLTQDSQLWKVTNLTFTDKPIYLLRFNNTEVLPRYQLRTQCKRYVSFLSGDQHPMIISSNAQVLKTGRVVITNPLQPSYFHNIIESMARLVVLRDHVLSKVENSDFKALLHDYPATRLGLELLGIPLDRVIWFPPGESLVQTKQVIVADWKIREDIAVNDRSIQAFSPPAWALRLLRDTYLNSLERKGHLSQVSANYTLQVLYISRLGRTMRAIENEAWLLHLLREVVHLHGGHLYVHTGHLPIVEQATEFHRSRVIIGPHGAGLSNIVFCQPGSSVVEFPSSRLLWHGYGYMAAALDLDYWIVPEMHTPVFSHYRTSRAIIKAVIDTAEAAIKHQLRRIVDKENSA